MPVIQQIKLVASLCLHFGEPFHGDDRLLLQIGDDGIAVAFALAILDSTDIPHPPIEAVFTEIRRYRNDIMMISRVMIPLQSRVRRIRTF